MVYGRCLADVLLMCGVWNPCRRIENIEVSDMSVEVLPQAFAVVMAVNVWDSQYECCVVFNLCVV